MVPKGAFEDRSGSIRIFVLVLTVIFGGIIGISLTLIYSLITGNFDLNPANMRILIFIQNSCIFIVSAHLATYLLWDAPMQNALKLKPVGISLILLGCLAMLVSNPLVDALNTWNQGLHLPEILKGVEDWMLKQEQEMAHTTEQLLAISTWGEFWMNILVIAVLAGVGEELLFRGVIQKLLIELTKNTHIGILITAIIFSAIHLQFFGFFPRVLLGVLLGYIFVWSKNLWVPIIAHTLNNALVIIFTPNDFNKGLKFIEDSNNVQNSTWMVITSIVLVAIFLFILKVVGKKGTVEDL